MTGWKPESSKTVHGREVTYLRARHRHEGAHAIKFMRGGVLDEVVVYPTAGESTRSRTALISCALREAKSVDGATIDPVAYLVGVLVLRGVTNIEVNGDPLFDAPAAEWKVTLTARGEVNVTHLSPGR